MKVHSMSNYFKTTTKMQKYKNIVEALELSSIMRKLSGISVFVLKVTTDNRIIRKFSLFGFTCFLLWYALYLYCTYKAHAEDQTVLRILYTTRVQRYGDDYERISSTLYAIFALWKIPFSLNTNNRFVEVIMSVDKGLEDLGEHVDYTRDAHLALNMTICQLVIYLFRLLSIWMSLSHLNVPVPAERLYQVVYSDALAFISTAHYCFFLKVVKGRYEHINRVLEDIKNHKSWEYKLFTRGSPVANVQKAVGLQDKYVCEKIKACAKMYGLLYKVTDATNRIFGSILMVTIFKSLVNVIIYLFYFMEATAAGLFHDVEKYIVFLIYVSWQIAYAIAITFIIVCVSERAVYAARNTSYIVHDIMNSDFSPAICAQAMQLSIQTVHQRPIFTAQGLYELNYPLLHQWSRSVATYLIILLQFVTDKDEAGRVSTKSVEYFNRSLTQEVYTYLIILLQFVTDKKQSDPLII